MQSRIGRQAVAVDGIGGGKDDKKRQKDQGCFPCTGTKPSEDLGVFVPFRNKVGTFFQQICAGRGGGKGEHGIEKNISDIADGRDGIQEKTIAEQIHEQSVDQVEFKRHPAIEKKDFAHGARDFFMILRLPM